MPKITFLPVQQTSDVPIGTSLLDAARLAGIEIDAPCGGKGTCGKCITRIVSGIVNTNPSLGHLPPDIINSGFVLACRTITDSSDLTIEIPGQTNQSTGQFIDESTESNHLRNQLFPPNSPTTPLTKKLLLNIPKPQLQDGLSDFDRLSRSFLQNQEKKEITIPLPILQQTASTLREHNHQVTVSYADFPSRYHLMAVEPGDTRGNLFGIAVDIGTTTVAVQLVDLNTGQPLATRTAYNDQLACGLDVISRINYAAKPQKLHELRLRVINTINRLLHQICQPFHIAPQTITSASIAGNTTMIHLLLGLNPAWIRIEPYTPTLLQIPPLTAMETQIDIYPHAPVYIAPAVGSYVGGDITSGLLCTPIAHDEENIILFIDIGTNGELVIGNRDFLVTCACSAGPAFEGGGIEHGMRAASGAIEKVTIDPASGLPSFQTIGNTKPRGICGSGMISLLANLFSTGWLDAAGKLNRVKPCPAIEINGRRARFIIATPGQSAIEQTISISEIDIENIIRAKAAIYSASALMLQQLDLDFNSLDHIYIAGGFGRFLNIENAITIGLLPDLPREKFIYLGNSALMGAYLTLISSPSRKKQLQTAQRMTYLELSTEPSYMHQYTGAMFLPHTDSRLFPSVSHLK